MTTKTKNSITKILVGLLAFALAMSGITKLIGLEMQIKNLESWSYPLWLRFPIGLSELAIGISLILPKFRKLTLYGILLWALVAVITHIQAGQMVMIGTPIFIGVLSAITLVISNSINSQNNP